MNEKNIDNFIDKLGRKQFRTQKKTWAKEELNSHALSMIHGGILSDRGIIESFSKWHKS